MNKLFINKIVHKELFINTRKKSILIVDKFLKLFQGSIKSDAIATFDEVKNAILLIRAKITNTSVLDVNNKTHTLERNEVTSNEIGDMNNLSRTTLRNEVEVTYLSYLETKTQELLRNNFVSKATSSMINKASILMKNIISSSSKSSLEVKEKVALRNQIKNETTSTMLVKVIDGMGAESESNSIVTFITALINKVGLFDGLNLNAIDTQKVKKMDGIAPTLLIKNTGSINMIGDCIAKGELAIRENKIGKE